MTPTTFEPDVHKGESCPVAFIGQVIGDLQERADEITDINFTENRRPAGERLGHYAERCWWDNDDRISSLRQTLGSHRALSLAGCLCQIAEARSLAGELHDLIDNPDHEADRLKRTINRLLYSVAMHLEGVAGMTMKAAGMDFTMPSNLNPWQACEEQIAEVRAKNAKVGR